MISTVNAGLLTSLPGRYAKALFQVAQANQQTEQLAKELKTLVPLYQSILQKTLLNDFLSMTQKIAIWREVAEKLSFSKNLQQFINVLLKEGRLSLLVSITEIYEELTAAAAGIVHVDIKSTTPLSKAQKKQIEEALMGRYAATIKASYDLAPELLGGVYIRQGSEVIDATLKGQLIRLAKGLEGEA